MTQRQFITKYLKPLEGAVITGTSTLLEDDQVWPVLTVKTKDGQTLKLEISQDEEGNGPGFIFGLPHPV